MFASGKKAHDFIHTNTQILIYLAQGYSLFFAEIFFWAKNNKTPPPIIQRPSLSVAHAALRCNESGATRERREKPPCLLCNYRWAKNEEERLIVCSVLCASVCVWGLLWPLLHTEAYCTNTHTHTCTHTQKGRLWDLTVKWCLRFLDQVCAAAADVAGHRRAPTLPYTVCHHHHCCCIACQQVKAVIINNTHVHTATAPTKTEIPAVE